MGLFRPKLDILPAGQRSIWQQLAATPAEFVLYGGTALALRLGHRQSVDFDFFSTRAFHPLEPDRSDDNGIFVASLMDIFGMKCATVPQRNEAKDYLDIHALITDAGLPLNAGIAAARAIYGRQYNPVLTLQALSYFSDLTDPLPAEIQSALLAAVKSVSLQELPAITALSEIGGEAAQP